ncbi:MAG TPA: potassium channel family protein [Chloroflexota bacterium]|nr:potassium channel family protein [Chloroflexota bacterium]
MTPKREPLIPNRIAIAIAMLVAVLVIGIVGFRVIEGFGWFDSFFLTVATITTLGDPQGRHQTRGGQALTLFIVSVGFAVLSYALLSLVPFVVEGHFVSAVNSRGMRRKVMRMQNHYIVCGFGRVGAEVARHLAEEGVPFLVIDLDGPSAAAAATAGYTVVTGNAADSAVLEHAGIANAKCLIAAVNTDADNLYVTVAARVLRPDLLIVARANTSEAEQRLKFAGADHILSPYKTAGRLMAQMAVRPQDTGLQDDLAMAGSSK